MKKRRLIVFLMALVLLLNFLGIASSGAWFISGGAFGENSYQSASIKFLPALEHESIYEAGIPRFGRLLKGTPKMADDSGALDPTKTVYISPGFSIIDTGTAENKYPTVLSLENFSTVITNVRVGIDVTFNTISSDGNDDPIFTGTTFKWQERTDTPEKDDYWYGMDYSKDGMTTFMPLLEAKFANTTKNGTVFPDGTTQQGNYTWSMAPATPPTEPPTTNTLASWDLTLAGNITAILPPTQGSTQFYNCITDFKIASDVGDPALQNDFNLFFSEHFAGHTITIEIRYYAKQELNQQWNLFDEKVFTTDAMVQSRAE